MRAILAILMLMMSLFSPHAFAGCDGKFINPITDVCWSCAWPLKLAGMSAISLDQEDTPNPSDSTCACNNPPRLGLTTSIFEPVRTVDVTATPFCMSSLGGIEMNPGFDATEGGVGYKSNSVTKLKHSFYQAHWYTNPMMYWLEVLLDDKCGEVGSFDLAYLTEVDPTWNDPELSLLLSPESALVANMVAQVACAVDCTAANVGFGLNAQFWCSGCNGPVFPLTGHVAAHVSGVQASSLIMHRMAYKMHREGLTWAGAGEDGYCGYYPQLVMDKTNYKYQMTYPTPQTEKILGRCCQPIGRTTLLWGAGKEIPYKNNNYSYLLFRKRNCCQ